jgi:hypothetical protein
VRQAHGVGGQVDKDVNNDSTVGRMMMICMADERQAVEADRRGRKRMRVRRT